MCFAKSLLDRAASFYNNSIQTAIFTDFHLIGQIGERFTVLQKNSQGPLVSDADHL